ncbi:MAG TPA: PQQ-binding-like beta-propeller repeat protein [Planctomycetota bacterium]
MIWAVALLLAQDWPSFLGPERDGKSKETGPLAWPPKPLWERDLGESFGAASVSKGRLYHFDRFGDQVRLSCLRADTGAELWRFEAPTSYVDGYGDNHGPRCCPVIDGDRVYAYGADGLLFCVGADGKLLWKRDTAADFGVVPNFFGVGSTPVVEGELLLVHVGGSPPNSPGVDTGEVRPAGSAIVAFDKKTGETKWKCGDELAAYGSPVVATVGGRRRGFVFARNGLLGFDPVKGAAELHFPWRAKSLQSVNACTPVVVDDLVFVADSYSVGAAVVRVKEKDVEVVWSDGRKRDRSFSAWWNTPIHVDGLLYGTSGQGGETDLRCVELKTGKVRWAEPGLGPTSLLYVDGQFLALSEDGTLRRLKANGEKYEELGKTATGLKAPARAAPVLARGILYVRGKDKLAAYQLIAEPKDVGGHSKRGDARFFAGDFAGALADYDRMVELEPGTLAQHWRRGIAAFYAGEYEKAAKQFEAYHSYDDVDRENGIWRYFSQHKAYGAAKAREGLLKYKKDDREPFPAVYALFEGKTTPEAILAGIAAARLDDEEREKRLFYAELYIGLNLAVEGKGADALPHLKKAAASRWGATAGYGPTYMWHVGRLHAELLGK